MFQVLGKFLEVAPQLAAALILAILGILSLCLADPALRHWAVRSYLLMRAKLRGRGSPEVPEPPADSKKSHAFQGVGLLMLVVSVVLIGVEVSKEVRASDLPSMRGCTESQLRDMLGGNDIWTRMDVPFFLVSPSDMRVTCMNSAAEQYYGREFSHDVTVEDLVNAKDLRRQGDPEESNDFKRHLWADIGLVRDNKLVEWDFIPKVWTDGSRLEVSQLRARRLDNGMYAILVLDISDEKAFPVDRLQAWANDPSRQVRLR